MSAATEKQTGKIRVALIGTVGIPAKYGGFETLAEHLVTCLGSRVEFTVYCSSRSYETSEPRFKSAKLVYLPLKPNGIQSIPYDILATIHAFGGHDVFLFLGASGAVVFPFLRFFPGKKVLINLGGLEWQRNKWNFTGKTALKFLERLAVYNSDAIIADNQVISEYIKQRYHRDSMVIAYGGDHAFKTPLTGETLRNQPYLAKPYSFTVCRIEPENNVHLMLEAFAALPDRELVVVGNWGVSTFSNTLLSTYSGFQNIHMLPAIYQPEKLNELRANCALYINGHSAGGTPPSLVEAMSLELPVAAYDTKSNRAATLNQANYFDSAKSLQNLITNLTAKELLENRKAMADIAREQYSWVNISEKYFNLFVA